MQFQIHYDVITSLQLVLVLNRFYMLFLYCSFKFSHIGLDLQKVSPIQVYRTKFSTRKFTFFPYFPEKRDLRSHLASFKHTNNYGRIHLRRWADTFCLHYNIFIYISHISIKPGSVQSHIILHLQHTDAYRPHPVHIEMEEFSDVLFKQRALIEFLTAEKVPPIEIHRRMQALYGDRCVDVSTVRRWLRRLTL